MTDRELMQQALEAMEYADACLKKQLTARSKHEYAQDLLMTVGTALRDRLAQPEQEPVAWVYPEGLETLKSGKPWTAYGTRQEPNNIALYLSPQPDIPPYAWVTFTPYGDEDDVWYENPEGQLPEGWTYKPLYDTTPPQRQWQGLTEAEKVNVALECGCADVAWIDLADAIEAKLKTKNT